MGNNNSNDQKNCSPYEIVIDGIVYRLPTILSVRMYERCTEIDKIHNLACKEKFAKLISEFAVTDGNSPLPFNAVLELDPKMLLDYITTFLNNNDYIKKVYDTYNDIEAIDKFWYAITIGTTNFFAGNIKTALQSLDTTDIITPLTSISEFGKSITQNFINFVTSEWYSSVVKGIADTARMFSETLSSIVKNIQIPNISEERIKELKASHDQWGKFGWTIIPSAPDALFDSAPITQLEADKLALRYCTGKSVGQIFVQLESSKRNSDDIREAIICYKNKCYKGCSLILFSIIDSVFIKNQGKAKDLKVGATAISIFKKKIMKKINTEKMLFSALYQINLFSCLFTFFDGTENFKKKVNVANRNYLDHGMTNKKVRKKDCIKLFLLLSNLLDFMDTYK